MELNNLRIWIAEDDDELREILGNSLANEDREIQLFKDGKEVLAAMPGGSFDILITDLVMPGADGIHILKEVKRFHPDRMVIIMTGYASIDSAIQAIRGGAYDYIRKPFKLEELEIIIKHASEKISLVRQNRDLLQRLEATIGEMNHLKNIWEKHLTNIFGLYSMMDHDQKISEMALILNQLNPAPPDDDLRKNDFPDKSLPVLEKLIQFRKEGLIDEPEFLAFKRRLLKE